jgi:hypothetical protein
MSHQANYNTEVRHRIAISISESEDMRELGMGPMHLQDALVESARQLLRSGYALAYGGDLAYEGDYNFTELLFQLAMTYGDSHERRIFNYSAFPMHPMIPEEKEADIQRVAEIIPVTPASWKAWEKLRYADAPDNRRIELDELNSANTEHAKSIWAESLTLMRKRMARETIARLVMGGKLNGYKGKYPGVIEETIYSIQEQATVVIDGRLGGAARHIVRILLGKQSLPEYLMRDDADTLKSASYAQIDEWVLVVKGNNDVAAMAEMIPWL